jgi:putative zinc finger/helix-turn-helix YgiT family protein
MPIIDQVQCFECNKGMMVPKKVSLVGSRNGEEFTVSIDGFECPVCGFKTIDNEVSGLFTQRISDEYRRAHGLLTSAEIRARRKRLGMNQRQFSDYLGVGMASIKRWELGNVQDRAMDELIRLKTDRAAAKQNLDALERATTDFICAEVVQYSGCHLMQMNDEDLRRDVREEEVLAA